jgi:hypothetical protein
MPEDKNAPDTREAKTEPQAPAPSSRTLASDKVTDKPHPTTIRLGLFSQGIAIAALIVAFLSFWTAQRAMKVAQRAYLTYQVSVINSNQVLEGLRTDKDFFLNYQISVTNMGNTPADSIEPKINVVPDPDRSPVIITFPNEAFDLGPKESRVLTGQALFKHFHNVRGLPGFSSGFTGQVEYKDVFGDSQAKKICYQYIVSGNSATGGMCGTVMQMLEIK